MINIFKQNNNNLLKTPQTNPAKVWKAGSAHPYTLSSGMSPFPDLPQLHHLLLISVYSAVECYPHNSLIWQAAHECCTVLSPHVMHQASSAHMLCRAL